MNCGSLTQCQSCQEVKNESNGGKKKIVDLKNVESVPLTSETINSQEPGFSSI